MEKDSKNEINFTCYAWKVGTKGNESIVVTIPSQERSRSNIDFEERLNVTISGTIKGTENETG